MLRKYKTSKRNRTNYNYYSAEGTKIVITPNDSEDINLYIELLHSMDDAEVDEQRRYDYRVTTNLDAYSDGASESINDRNKYLADDSTNPEQLYIEGEDKAEHQDMLDMLSKAMEVLTFDEKDLIKKKFVDNKTNVAIATERNVSETTIRKNLKRLYKKLGNILTND